SICVRGSSSIKDLAELGERSVLLWAQAIGRDRHLKINTACNPAADAVVTLNHPFIGDLTCGASDFAYATPNSLTIYLCRDSGNLTGPVVLHEIGHIWGMCDQYEGAEASCDPNHLVKDGTALGSLMDAS